MKKTYLMLLGAGGLLLAINAQGQGSIYLNGYDAGIIVQKQTPPAAATTAPQSTFVEVFGGATAGSMTAITPFGASSPVFQMFDTAGDFDAGYGFANGVAVSSSGFFQVFCWIGPAGSLYDLNTQNSTVTFAGHSSVFTSTTGDHPVSPNLPTPGALLVPGNIVVVPTPEPGTLALAGLGAAALLVFRRRK